MQFRQTFYNKQAFEIKKVEFFSCMAKYIYNPGLLFIKEFPGNKIINGCFTNDAYHDVDASLLKVLKWKISPNPQKMEKEQENYKLEVVEGNGFLNSPEDKIVWLGHASFFLRVGGMNFITDPCFENLPFIKRLAPLPCEKKELNNIDYLLISHGHRDHLDEKSIKHLLNYNPLVKVLLPLKLGKIIKEIDKKIECIEFAWYQYLEIKKDLKIIFLPAVH